MDDRHREILRQKGHIIRRDLEPDRVVRHLTTILSEEDIEEIKQLPVDSRLRKADRLLDMLPRRGPNAFKAFIEALRKVNQSFLADHLIDPGGSCSRCAELEEQLHFVTSDRDSIREKKQNLDKEILEMRKRNKGTSEAYNEEIRTVLKDVQIARKNLAHKSERVVEESKKQVQAIKDLQLENGKLKEMIKEKITKIGEITELLAKGQAALKNISEQLGET
ncbi:uncharacterized protein PF3D7_1120000-like isoform X2 [Montipora capricornis]